MKSARFKHLLASTPAPFFKEGSNGLQDRLRANISASLKLQVVEKPKKTQLRICRNTETPFILDYFTTVYIYQN